MKIQAVVHHVHALIAIVRLANVKFEDTSIRREENYFDFTILFICTTPFFSRNKYDFISIVHALGFSILVKTDRYLLYHWCLSDKRYMEKKKGCRRTYSFISIF